MQQMFPRLTLFIVLVAALLAAEPLLHSHPLQSSASGATSSTACAICATGTGRLPIVTASVGAPQAIVHTYASVVVPIVAVDDPLPLPSRAPPAA